MSAKQKIPFDVALSRLNYGEKTELSCISDEINKYWIIPRKFSVEGMDAINALRNKQQKAFSKPLAQILKNKDLSGVDSQSKVIDMLTQEELNELISQTPNDAMDKKTLYVIYLKYGIAKHNLEGEESTIITEDLIDRILDGTKLSAEIYEIIEGFNSFFTSASK